MRAMPTKHKVGESMRFRQVLGDLDADIRQVSAYSADFSGDSLRWTRKLSIAATPTMICCILYRVAHWFWVNGHPHLARSITWLNYVINKAIISPEANIGPGLYVPHTVGVVFQGHAGSRLTIYGHGMVCSSTPIVGRLAIDENCPVLGDDVVVGAHAAVVGPIHIGSGSTIGLGVGLDESLPPRSIVIPGVSTTIPLTSPACDHEALAIEKRTVTT